MGRTTVFITKAPVRQTTPSENMDGSEQSIGGTQNAGLFNFERVY